MKRTIDTTRESHEAEAAMLSFDAVRQFGIPNLEVWLKTAYYHGYRDALVRERHGVGKTGEQK